MFGLGSIAWAIFGGRQFVLGAIKFLSTPLGQVVAIAGALLVTAVAADVHARIRDRAVCNGRIERLVEKAAAAAKTRDAEIAAAAEQKFAPYIATSQAALKRTDELKRQVDHYEKQILGEKASGAVCQLGADALRLRKPRK